MIRAASLVVCAALAPATSAQVCSAGTEPGCRCQVPDTPTGLGVLAAYDFFLVPEVADNFTLTRTTELDALTWWGTFGNPFTGYCGATEPTPEFRITFHDTDAMTSLPANVVAGPFTIGPAALTATATGNSVAFTGTGFTLPEFEYSSLLPAPVALAAGEYWISIRQTNFGGGPCGWLWETTSSGDTTHASGFGSPPTWAAGTGDLTWCLETRSCQPDLGFQGPGSVAATMCGTGLRTGESSDYMLTAAESNAGGVLLVSGAGFANVPVLLGTLVSFGGFFLQAPVVANVSGELTVPIAGNSTVVGDLVFQSVMFDSTTPTGLAFSNALLVQYGT